MTTSKTTNDVSDNLEEKPLFINKEDEDEDEDEDETSSECSDDEDEDENDDFLNLKLNEKTPIYLLCKDDTPLCYFSDKKLASEYMWKFARLNNLKYMNDFSTFIKVENEDSISIVGYNRFLIVVYERLFSKFHITKVNEMESFTCETDKNVNDTELDATSLSRWWG
jgi:hypothetical protein